MIEFTKGFGDMVEIPDDERSSSQDKWLAAQNAAALHVSRKVNAAHITERDLNFYK